MSPSCPEYQKFDIPRTIASNHKLCGTDFDDVSVFHTMYVDWCSSESIDTNHLAMMVYKLVRKSTAYNHSGQQRQHVSLVKNINESEHSPQNCTISTKKETSFCMIYAAQTSHSSLASSPLRTRALHRPAPEQERRCLSTYHVDRVKSFYGLLVDATALPQVDFQQFIINNITA